MCNLGLHECLTKMCAYMCDGTGVSSWGIHRDWWRQQQQSLWSLLGISSSSYAYIITLHPHIGGEHFNKWRGLAQVAVLSLVYYCIEEPCSATMKKLADEQTDKIFTQSKYKGTSYFEPEFIFSHTVSYITSGGLQLPPRDRLKYDSQVYIKSDYYKTFVLLDIPPSSLLLLFYVPVLVLFNMF